MGGGISSNVANIVEKVSNDIITSAGADSQVVQNCINSEKFINCDVGSIDIQNSCIINTKMNNIVSQSSQDTLNSQVAQSLLQNATSSVGSMGIGYASASNLVSALLTSSNSITHSLTSSASAIINDFNDFTCQGSKIGSIQITDIDTSNVVISNILKQIENSVLLSSVSQQISQTASATVEGLTSFIIALAVLIFAVGYVAFKPVGMLLSNKIFMITVITITLVSILIFMYIKQLPPFFNEPLKCTQSQASTCCGGTSTGCVDLATATINVTTTPARYATDIIGADGTIPGSNPSGSPGLLQLVIAKQNTGWSKATYDYFQSSDLVTKNNFPNPLLQTGLGLDDYVTNAEAWQQNLDSDNRKSFARFILCNLLGIDTSVYIFDDESCLVNGQIISPADQTRGCIKFTPGIMPQKSNIDKAISGAGTLSGQFGNCDTPGYRFQNFMKKGGFIIPIVGIILIFGGILFFNRSPGAKSE